MNIDNFLWVVYGVALGAGAGMIAYDAPLIGGAVLVAGMFAACWWTWRATRD